jgi:hypothetical protein
LVVLPLFAPGPAPASLPAVRPERSVAMIDLSKRGAKPESAPTALAPAASASVPAVVVASAPVVKQAPVKFLLASVEGCAQEVQLVSSLAEFPTRRLLLGEVVEAPFRRELSLRFEAEGFVTQTIQVVDRVPGSELAVCLEKISEVTVPQPAPKPIVVRAAPAPKPVAKVAPKPKPVVTKPKPAPEPVKPKTDGKKTANNSLD